MESTLVRFILSPFGVVGVVIAVLLLAFFIVYRLTRWATKISVEHDDIVDKSKDMTSTIKDINKDLSYIKGTLEMLTKSAENSLAQAHSPLSLTEKGKSLASDMNIAQMIDANWQQIKQVLDDEVRDKNPYDIQEYCRQTAAVEPEKFLSQSDILFIKQMAYRTGKTFFELSIIPALQIRDRYLLEKGISIEEIDKHDPSKH